MGHIEGVDRNQLFLFPEALEEYAVFKALVFPFA